MKSEYGPFLSKLLDKPDVTMLPFCAVCGRPAHDKHHIIQKGMGGVTDEIDAKIPRVRLCGDGNNSGCHGKLHHRLLHVYWEDGRADPKGGVSVSQGYIEPGYVFLFTKEPVDDLTCWEDNRSAYLPLPGWLEQVAMTNQYVFGRGGRRK